jgi:hypothetical protein
MKTIYTILLKYENEAGYHPVESYEDDSFAETRLKELNEVTKGVYYYKLIETKLYNKGDFKKSEKTYRVGQKFVLPSACSDIPYMLCYVGNECVSFINTTSGYAWKSGKSVEDCQKITEDELKQIYGYDVLPTLVE